jgi:hypothetical protein
MDTIGEAVEYIAALSKQAASHDLTHMIGLSNPANGKIFSYPFRIKTTQYGREIGEAISPFRSAKMTVSTLRGFADAIHAGVAGTLENFQNGNLIVHVEDHHTVSVKSTGVDDFGVRDTLLTAKYQPSGAFEFGTYNGDLTKLVIALQCCFIPDEELLKLLRLVSNLKTGTGMHVQVMDSTRPSRSKTERFPW